MRDNKQFRMLAEVLNSALETVAHKPLKNASSQNKRGAVSVDFSKINNPCGFMSTVRQNAQHPHTDTSKASIAAHRKFAQNNRLHLDLLPWHTITPLSNGGRLLFVWGVQGDKNFCKSPILVHCPRNCIVMWR